MAVYISNSIIIPDLYLFLFKFLVKPNAPVNLSPSKIRSDINIRILKPLKASEAF